MSNSLTIPKSLPPEAFSDAGDDLGGADFLLFDGKTGTWTRGRGKEEISAGTELVVLIDRMLKGFTRFDDGVPTSRFLPIWPVPDLQALRQSLGDLDPALWPNHDAKGNPQDPWRPARQLPVILIEHCECLVYSTSSFGGLKACSQLGRAVQRQRRYPEQQDALPIASLDVDDYLHSVKAFGRIFDPLLPVIDWTSHRAVEEAMRRGRFDIPAVKPELAEDTEREPVEDERPTKQTAPSHGILPSRGRGPKARANEAPASIDQKPRGAATGAHRNAQFADESKAPRKVGATKSRRHHEDDDDFDDGVGF
jgi:hypothetical protein